MGTDSARDAKGRERMARRAWPTAAEAATAERDLRAAVAGENQDTTVRLQATLAVIAVRRVVERALTAGQPALERDPTLRMALGACLETLRAVSMMRDRLGPPSTTAQTTAWHLGGYLARAA